MKQQSLIPEAKLFGLLTVLQAQNAVIDDCMETVRYQEFTAQIASDTVSLASAEGQFLYAKVLLNEALYNMKTPRFSDSIGRINSSGAVVPYVPAISS